MSTVALIAASLAALVLAVVGIKVYVLLTRVHRLLDQVGRILESDVRPTIEALGGVAQGARRAVGKVDDGLTSVANALERVDRLTGRLEPDSVARGVVEPLVAKILAWITRGQKGAASAGKPGASETSVEQGEEPEAG